MIYVAFVIDVFARKIVGWRVSRSMTTQFVLDALNQAICQRCPIEADNLIHPSDRGSQYLAIRYAKRLVEAALILPLAALETAIPLSDVNIACPAARQWFVYKA